MENSSGFSREELERIVVLTALAYYDRNPYVQYDDYQDIMADGVKRTTRRISPEQVDLDAQMYSDCASYMFEIYHDAFRYALMGRPERSLTRNMVAVPLTEPMMLLKFGGEDGRQDREQALAEFRAMLRPGDLIVGRGKTGHVMMYVGDLYGDGHEYMIHCWGRSADLTTGEDRVEPEGAIYIQDVDESCFRPDGKRGWYIGDEKHGAVFALLRPLDASDIVLQPTPAALTRRKFPRISVSRRLDRWRFDSVRSGEEVPVTVTVANCGREDFHGVPVKENLPVGLSPVPGSVTEGAVLRDGALCWTADIPAGEKAEFTYRVRVTGAPGVCVTFPAGTVDGLRTREITVPIGFAPLTQAQVSALAQVRTDDLPASPEAWNLLYRRAFGAELGLPDSASALLEGILQRRTVTEKVSGEMTDLLSRSDNPALPLLAPMLLPLHPTGFFGDSFGASKERVREYQACFYRPGDLLLGLYGENRNRIVNSRELDWMVCLGDGTVLKITEDGGAEKVPFDESVGRALRYNLFLALRPTLAREI